MNPVAVHAISTWCQEWDPGKSTLDARGKFAVTLQSDKKTAQQDIFVVRGLSHAFNTLLGKPAIEALGLVRRVQSTESEKARSIQEEFPQLFQGLEKVEGEYDSAQ